MLFKRLVQAATAAFILAAQPAPAQQVLKVGSTPTPGRQDHTSLPYASAARVSRSLSVHRNPSLVRDDGRRPSCRDGMAVDIAQFRLSGKAKHFLFRGLTWLSVNQK